MKFLKNNRGVAIIYVTLFLVVLGLLFLALGIDIGWLAYVRSRGQAMVDASALSAAAAIPSYKPAGDTTKVFDMAKAFNSGNTVLNGDAGIQTSTNSSTNVEFCSGPATSPSCVPASSVPDTKQVAGVKVTRTFQAPLFFGNLFNGGSTADITVSSTAYLGGVASGIPQIHLAFDVCDLPKNPDGSLNCGGVPSALLNPGTVDNARWTTYFGTGTPQCMTSAPIPTVLVGDVINTIGSGNTTPCWNDLQSAFNSGAKPRTDPPCPSGSSTCWRVTVPVITGGCPGFGSSSNGTVLGFATFDITNVINSSSDREVIGSLQCPIFLPNSSGSGDDFGTYATHAVLVK